MTDPLTQAAGTIRASWTTYAACRLPPAGLSPRPPSWTAWPPSCAEAAVLLRSLPARTPGQ